MPEAERQPDEGIQKLRAIVMANDILDEAQRKLGLATLKGQELAEFIRLGERVKISRAKALEAIDKLEAYRNAKNVLAGMDAVTDLNAWRKAKAVVDAAQLELLGRKG